MSGSVALYFWDVVKKVGRLVNIKLLVIIGINDIFKFKLLKSVVPFVVTTLLGALLLVAGGSTVPWVTLDTLTVG